MYGIFYREFVQNIIFYIRDVSIATGHVLLYNWIAAWQFSVDSMNCRMMLDSKKLDNFEKMYDTFYRRICTANIILYIRDVSIATGHVF